MVTFVGLGTVWPSSAYAWGDASWCTAVNGASRQQVNRWTVFAGHHMDVDVKMCFKRPVQDGKPNWIIKYSRTPKVSFPGRFGTAWTESVELTQAPYVSKVGHYTYMGVGYVAYVRYRYSVKQCTSVKVFCNDFDFTVDYDVGGTQICFVGGSCDAKKYW